MTAQTDILRSASAWLQGKRHDHAAQTVIYRRGALEICLRATIGRTEFTRDDEAGASIVAVSRDFLVRADDLMVDGAIGRPQAGDRILESTPTGQIVHEVAAPGDQPVWRYSDAWRLTLRIHTNEIGTG